MNASACAYPGVQGTQARVCDTICTSLSLLHHLLSHRGKKDKLRQL